MKVRNTPTCVGKTQNQWDLFVGMVKHPHVRGEDLRPWRC